MRALFFIFISTFLAACTTAPRYANKINLDGISAPNRAGAKSYVVESCETPEIDENCKKSKQDVFVGVAISGGGSRAAAYSAAVLRELDSIGILQNVSTISSVSGGSLTAAYVASRGKPFEQNPSEFWDKAKDDLSQNFRTKFVMKLLRPDNFIKSSFGSLGRSEVMAEVFDETIFHGTTFHDLGKNGPGLVLNATAINEIGPGRDRCTNRKGYSAAIKWESISFTEEFFNNCLSSTLDQYPLSRAVSASAAFPGLFSAVPLAVYQNPMTRNFLQNKYGTPPALTPVEYLHVIDGGASDNLGIEGLLGPWAAKAAKRKVKINRCLIIVIDAFASGDADNRGRSDDTRSIADRIVDSNFFDSIDSMLKRRREETLRNLGIVFPKFSPISSTWSNDSPRVFSDKIEDFPIAGASYNFSRTIRTSTVKMRDAIGEKSNSFLTLDDDDKLITAEDPECLVWYLGIDALREQITAKWEFSEQRIDAQREKAKSDPSYEPSNEDVYKSLNKYMHSEHAQALNAAWELASRVKTDFDLVGPKNCTRSVLNEALWIAGTASVNADVKGRQNVCNWFKESGLSVSQSCDSDVQFSYVKLPVKYISNGHDTTYSVECK